MFGFLQGFALGLFISCTPWLVVGMVNPRLALPEQPPRRWQVVLRYGLLLPLISILILLIALLGGLLWGGFNPSLLGWLLGLLAIPISLYVERRWYRWQVDTAARRRKAERERAAAQRREARLRQQHSETGLRILEPALPPAGADTIVLTLCALKQRLLDAKRPDLALMADRLYTRYRHVGEVIASKFDPREMTFERAMALVTEVCRSAVDQLEAMASLAYGTVSIDGEFVRQRLRIEGRQLSAEERAALQRRLDLLDSAEQRIREFSGRIEAALTALDDTAVAVSAVETARPQAAVAADQALQDLRRFVERAPSYSRHAE